MKALDEHDQNNKKLEHELLWKMREADLDGVSQFIKEFCEVQMAETCCEELAKIRSLELMVFVSKELKLSEDNLDEIVKLDSQHLFEWNNHGRIEHFCAWFEKSVIANYLKHVKKGPISRKNKLVQEIKLLIQEQFQKDITLNDIANRVFASAFYVSKIFKEEVGIGIKEYLTGVRIEEAKRLLTHTDLTISEIADRTGYKGQSYFGKVFKEIVGLTPSEFRMLKW